MLDHVAILQMRFGGMPDVPYKVRLVVNERLIFVGGGNDLTNVHHRVMAAPTLVLPTGPALYNANVWTSDDVRTMQQLYSDGMFFQNFMSGLQSYYTKDWESTIYHLLLYYINS